MIMRITVCNRLLLRPLLSIFCFICLVGIFSVRAEANRNQAAYYRALVLIQEGEQLVRNGEHLLSKRPSSLSPNEDLREDHSRGTRMVQEGRHKIMQGRTQIAQIDEIARKEEDQRRQSFVPSEIVSKSIEKLPVSQVLESIMNHLTETLPGEIPHRVFFHGCFYNNQGSYSRFQSLEEWFDARMQTTGKGTESISRLPEVEWQVNEEHPLGAILHQRLKDFRGSRSAAIATVEILNWENFPWLLASVTAMEIESWKVLSHKVWLIQKDQPASQIFGSKIEEPSSETPVIVKVDDRVSFLKHHASSRTQRLDNGSESPYTPELQFWQTLVKVNLLQDGIPVNHYDWVKRAYFPQATPQPLADKRADLGLRIVPSPSALDGAKLESFQLRDNKVAAWGWVHLQTSDHSSSQNGKRE